jgi:hypothetical protein
MYRWATVHIIRAYVDSDCPGGSKDKLTDSVHYFRGFSIYLISTVRYLFYQSIVNGWNQWENTYETYLPYR